MDWDFLVRILASILAESSPLVFACLGETLTEKAGVINLSLDGSILLSAMTGFAVASLSGSLVLGFLSAMGVGASICKADFRIKPVQAGGWFNRPGNGPHHSFVKGGYLP